MLATLKLLSVHVHRFHSTREKPPQAPALDATGPRNRWVGGFWCMFFVSCWRLWAGITMDYHIKYVDLRWFKPSKLTQIEFHCGTTFLCSCLHARLKDWRSEAPSSWISIGFFRENHKKLWDLPWIYHEKWMVRQQNCLQWPRTAYGSRMFVFRHFWWPKECVQVFPRASLVHWFTLFHPSFQAMLGSPRGRDGRNAADKDDMAPHRTSCGRSHTKSRCPRGKLRLFCAMCIV